MSDFNKIKWETSDLTNTGNTVKKTINYREISEKWRGKTRRNSGPTPVARGGDGSKAPPLAARPVKGGGSNGDTLMLHQSLLYCAQDSS